MKVLITGGSGFIGSRLCAYFLSLGYDVSILTRKIRPKKNIDFAVRQITDLNPNEDIFDVIINLAGKPLNENRWNDSIKKSIYDSRIQTTLKVIEYIKNAHSKPKLLISGSAIGFYGNGGNHIFTEDSQPADQGFPHKLCRDWEQTAQLASEYGVRVCLLRTGIVLGKEGGALKEMIIPFKFGLGAQLGDGNQWMSWIHMEDIIGIIEFLIYTPTLSGPINLTAPEPVPNTEFCAKLAAVLHRPCFLKLPDFFVESLFGEMGKVLLLQGQRGVPDKLLKAGYVFKFPMILEALQDVIEGKALVPD